MTSIKAVESLGRILQPERHPKELKQTERREDTCFGDVLRSHQDMVIPAYQIDLGEVAAACEVRGEVLDVRDGVAVWGSNVVQASVVATGTPVCRRPSAPYARVKPTSRLITERCPGVPCCGTLFLGTRVCREEADRRESGVASPFVGMKCSTPCFVLGVLKEG